MSGTGTDMLIGLGGQRCGSSWLYEMLARHPQIIPARGEKEVHFFDRNWHRGLAWYADLWPDPLPQGALRWESTPSYLYEATARERIAKVAPQARFVVLLRDPVTRSVSHYKRFTVNTGRSLSFSEAAKERRTIVNYSTYAQHIEAYYEAFGRDRVFVSFFEDISHRPAKLCREIMHFAGISASRLRNSDLEQRVNEVKTPRHSSTYKTMYKAKGWLKRRGLDGVVSAAHRSGVVSLVSSRRAVQSPKLNLKPSEMAHLELVREEQISALSDLGIDAGHWRTADASRQA